MKIKKIDIIENKKGTEASTEVIIDCDFPRSEKVYRVEEHDPISYEKIQKKASIKASIRRKKLFLLLGWTLAVEAVLFKLFNSWS